MGSRPENPGVVIRLCVQQSQCNFGVLVVYGRQVERRCSAPFSCRVGVCARVQQGFCRFDVFVLHTTVSRSPLKVSAIDYARNIKPTGSLVDMREWYFHH